ncbi:hypothetical protein BDR03DRAFT_1014067 [Suillus americanus]|nr:hypothetical protein BDR03DRAFT_1014067 [Suillus americanus]
MRTCEGNSTEAIELNRWTSTHHGHTGWEHDLFKSTLKDLLMAHLMLIASTSILWRAHPPLDIRAALYGASLVWWSGLQVIMQHRSPAPNFKEPSPSTKLSVSSCYQAVGVAGSQQPSAIHHEQPTFRGGELATPQPEPFT